VRLLVDTQCWLWMVADPDRLSRSARALISSEKHELFLSAVSSWEISIKHGLGKLALPAPPREFVPTRMQVTRVLPLAVTHEHALRVADLPWHHRDPFDRLLVAQAQAESLSLLTADRQLRPYDVSIVWAAGRRK
jgi:PIN domain nuclease of toxin-antitoxin system